MAVTRVKVVVKPLHPHASKEDRDRNFRIAHELFKRCVDKSGVLSTYKAKQEFESPGEKRRRKRRGANLVRKNATNRHNKSN